MSKNDEMAEEFMEKTEIGPRFEISPRTQNAQFNVATEEFNEFTAAYTSWFASSKFSDEIGHLGTEESRAEIAEELADVEVTIRVLALMMDIDLDGAYEAKMDYNMKKSVARNEDGKVTDDASVEKPDFVEYVGGNYDY